ncbi:hypothetical protein SODG_004226 [Sodalis praecaptivus]
MCDIKNTLAACHYVAVITAGLQSRHLNLQMQSDYSAWVDLPSITLLGYTLCCSLQGR